MVPVHFLAPIVVFCGEAQGAFGTEVGPASSSPSIATIKEHYNSTSDANLVLDGLQASSDTIQFKITNNTASTAYYSIKYEYTAYTP